MNETKKAIKTLSMLMTVGGIVWFLHGGFTNGLLLMILGELVEINAVKKHD